MRVWLPFALFLLSGCIARAAVDVVTLPVKVVGKGIDSVTTSQAESDRNRGRAERKAEKRAAKARHHAEKYSGALVQHEGN